MLVGGVSKLALFMTHESRGGVLSKHVDLLRAGTFLLQWKSRTISMER